MEAHTSSCSTLNSTPGAPRPRGAGSSSTSQPKLPTHVQRNRLTPRSAEACRRTGVEPAELLPLPQSAFREPGQLPEVEKLRWKEYDDIRMDAYQAVRAERDRIIAEQAGRPFVPDAAAAGHSLPQSSSAAALLESAAKAEEASASAQDARAVEKIKKKQQAELEQMILFEIRCAQLNQEKADKLQAMAEAEAREKSERLQRQKVAAELRMQIEADKRVAEARHGPSALT